jgi:hypothetical protein
MDDEQRNDNDDGSRVRKPDPGYIGLCRVVWKPGIGHVIRRRTDQCRLVQRWVGG